MSSDLVVTASVGVSAGAGFKAVIAPPDAKATADARGLTQQAKPRTSRTSVSGVPLERARRRSSLGGVVSSDDLKIVTASRMSGTVLGLPLAVGAPAVEAGKGVVVPTGKGAREKTKTTSEAAVPKSSPRRKKQASSAGLAASGGARK